MDSNYQAEWSCKYRMRCSDKGETYAFCEVCGVDFSVAGGSVDQVKRHCKNKKHSSKLMVSAQPTMQMLMTQQCQTLGDRVTCTELYFTKFVTEYNLPFAIADHFNSLCSVMFSDSRIAVEFTCARTKTAALFMSCQ